MEEKIEFEDKIELVGVIGSEPTITHSYEFEDFYEFTLNVERASGQIDSLPIVCSKRIFSNTLGIGSTVHVSGQIRTRNVLEGEKSRLKITVFARELFETAENHMNEVEITGVIVKQPNFRTTPFQREITDLLVATNCHYNRSYYIPCIVWGRNARYASQFEIGKGATFVGRLQSRNYTKNDEVFTAYEVSVSTLKEI